MSSMTPSTISAAQTNGVAAHRVFSRLQASSMVSATMMSTRTVTLARKLPKPIARHFSVQGGAAQPERLGRFAEIALVPGGRLVDCLLFPPLEVQRRRRRRERNRQKRLQLGRAGIAHDDESLDRVPQLPNVAGPGIVL